MPKRGRKFITEFLVPNLNDETFGVRLAWVDRELPIFQMQWNHKAASAWTEDDCQVFVEWDKKRGHYRPMEKEYFTKSKQRFRAVLNKSIRDNEITQLQSEDKNIKIYFLGPVEAAPFDLKFNIVKEIIEDKNDILVDNLDMDSKSMNSLYSVEGDQPSKTDYCNALKDHNYQNIEEHKISDNYYNSSYDASGNNIYMYPCDDEKNVNSFNVSDLTFDEKSLENLPFILGSKKECDLLLENNFLHQDQVLHRVETFVLTNSVPDNSLGISSKRGLEQSYCPPAKKSKILLYLKADT